MATGVNYWSSYEFGCKVSDSVWGGGQESTSEEGGDGFTWKTHLMEVKGQLISAPEPLCSDRKQRERMSELQERRRSLQALLSTRLAELRHICLQEAELTGAVPSDFPLEVGEKPPCVRRRGGTSCQGNRKCRVEKEDCQRSKPKKTLFSGALKKYSCSENNTHSQTHTHNGKRTVHRGCHTDNTVRSESSSTSDSTGHDNDDHPPLVSAVSPVEVFNQNKTWKNAVHSRTKHQETLQTQKSPPQPPSHPLPPPRSQDSSSSSGPSDCGAGREGGGRTAGRSNDSDGPLHSITPPEEEGGVQQGAAVVNTVSVSQGPNATRTFWSFEALTDKQMRKSNCVTEGGGRVGGTGPGGGGYSEVLLDYVWGKQLQLQHQQSQPNNQTVMSQQKPLYNGCSAQQPPGVPPTYHSHHGNQRRVTVTRTKSCGPFLPVQQSQVDAHHPTAPSIQPDPHPHLLPPRPPQLLPHQDSQLEEATRSLHKALALEGLRDWYLRNTLGSSHQNQASGKVTTGANTKKNPGVKGQVVGGEALQRRRMTHGVVQLSSHQRETSHQFSTPLPKPALPHSATFHGHPLDGRSVDNSFYQDSFPSQEVLLRDPPGNQLSPGTLV